MVRNRRPLWLPLIVLVQLVLTLGLALLVSALTVHFRDIRDILSHVLHLWFFATPIIYPSAGAGARRRRLLVLNPITHVAVSYQEMLFDERPFTDWMRVAVPGRASRLAVFAIGQLRVRSTARHARGGSREPAIEYATSRRSTGATASKSLAH